MERQHLKERIAQSNAESASSRDEDQPEQAPETRTLRFSYEFYRLLSFPYKLAFYLVSLLAKLGFYFSPDDNSARCHFCSEVISPVTSDMVVKPHNCKKTGNIELRANTSDYRYECNRILNFRRHNWPYVPDGRFHVGALDLARWGFYYTGEDDAARCNFCGLEVRGWEKGDTAESEHRRWNPHCPFLNGIAVGNIPLRQENHADRVVVLNDDPTFNIKRFKISTPGSVMSSSDLGMPARHPEYASLSSRLNSYGSWPLSMEQRPQQLADAGFYYTGTGDRVICYQCGGGLKDWDRTDQPWVEHAIWFPRCSYLNLQKGMNFVQHVQLLNQQADESGSAAAVPVINPQPASIPTPADVESQTNEVPVERQCKICMEKELGIVFLPCGHMAACVDCARQLSNCPLCRGHVSAYIRAFLP